MAPPLNQSPADDSHSDRSTEPQNESSRDRSRQLSRHHRLRPPDLPGYQIERLLGDGAFGTVWLAREQNTGREVAIKFYTHHGRVDWPLLNREVEKLAALDSSPFIVDLISVGWEHDPPYYVMEYLEQGSLSRFLADGPLPVEDTVHIARGVLRGLVHAHGRGILHCDLKPGNVLLDDDLEPRLCDFGQARLTHEQDPALGTLYYMAPEQADLDAVPDARWDVYALGALIYQMLTGRPPYRSSASEQAIRRQPKLTERLTAYRRLVRAGPPPSEHRGVPGVDRSLADLVDRCLQVDPRQRFPNAQAVVTALASRDRRRTRRPLFAMAVAAFGVLLAAMAALGVQADRSIRQQVTEGVLERNSSVALGFSYGVQLQLNEWQAELVLVAGHPELARRIRDADRVGWEKLPEDQREELRTWLVEQRKTLAEIEDEPDNFEDTSWLLTDRHGIQRWRNPFDEKTIDHSYAYRDYFHGAGYDLPPEPVRHDIKPIGIPHLSIPFRSTATQRFMVALAVPVKDPDNPDQTIAVLARTIELRNLVNAKRLEMFHGGDQPAPAPASGRTVVLFDRTTGEMLSHPWLSRSDRKQLRDSEFRKLNLPAETLKQIAAVGANEWKDETYRDPARSMSPDYAGEYLAAGCPVGEFNWFAVVQERRTVALKPVAGLQQRLLLTAVGSLLAGAAFLLLLRFVDLRRGRAVPGRFRGEGDTSSISSTSLPALSSRTDGR